MSVLAAGSGGVESAGTTYVFVRLTKARLRRVAGARTVHAVLRLVAKDDVGNQDVVQRPLVLRR
jgi:hypothetical protein